MEMSTLDVRYYIMNKMSLIQLEEMKKYIKETIQFKKDCIGSDQADEAIRLALEETVD